MSDPAPDRFSLVPTRHGALALHDAEAGEIMHPGLGPAGEAETLHVKGSGVSERLARPDPRPLVLFDVGLGAGSNASAALRARAALPAPRPLEIISFENDLGPFRYALNHPEAFALPPGAQALADAGLWEAEGVRWRLCLGDAYEELARQPQAAEVTFWDPYSQGTNPQLWTTRAFARARAAAAPDAVMTMFSGSTTVRCALLFAGWFVGPGPVVQGRASSLAATRRDGLTELLDASFLLKRRRSTAPWPSDAPDSPEERLLAHPQFEGMHIVEPKAPRRRKRR